MKLGVTSDSAQTELTVSDHAAYYRVNVKSLARHGVAHQRKPNSTGTILVGMFPVFAYSYRASVKNFTPESPSLMSKPPPSFPPIPPLETLRTTWFSARVMGKLISKIGSNTAVLMITGWEKSMVRR